MLDSETIEGFVGSLLQRKFDQATAIPNFHKELWDLCCDEKNKYVAIAAPRSHAKSTSITFSYLLAALLFRQHQFVVLLSDTEAQAILFLGDIKQELIENEALIKLFGVSKFTKLSETDIIVEMNDGYRFRVIAKGAEQKLRGLKWDGKRPDLILADDLENEEATASQDRREKFRRWFYGALLPVKSEKGKVIVVGTILHMDSLLERLMPIASSKTSINEDLKLYCNKPNSMWKAVKYRAHNSDFSKILWPDRFSKQTLQEKKQWYFDQGLPDIYSQEFLNYPIDENTAYFRRDDFLPLDTKDTDSHLVYYAAVDFAVSTKERSDYTVIAVVGVNQEGHILVKDIRRGRWDSHDIIEEMFSVQRRYKPELFVVEQGTIEKAIGPFLKREMTQRNVYMNLYPMVPTNDKMKRARSIQARMRAGGIRFDKDATWYPMLEDEMVRFPKDKHDDQVDALAWVGLVIDQIQEAPTLQQLAEEEYQEEVSNSSYDQMCPFTGY